MNLTIRSHNTTLEDGLREHAEKKLSRLERYLPRVDDIVIEVEHEETRSAAHRYAVQITVHSGSSILRGEERAAEAQTALDRAADVISRQAQRHTKRLHSRHRGAGAKEFVAEVANAAPPPPPAPGDSDEDEYVLGRIVRVKHFEAKPMSHEEALAQMDLIGHDFFLFLDSTTNDYALLYKRKDGDHGLLTPARG